MRLELTQREVSHSGMLQVSQAQIKASAKLFDMFANDTYANKPLAIMRETVSNGMDAHTAAGCPQRPVEVKLATTLDPMCVVRDFGTGMPHDFVMGDFMQYTNGSTKDGDDGQIGGFGIGSKSPLSYVDQFGLRVVHEGILSVYTLFKGEDGIPAIGLQGQTTTDEPNGVEISFPVEEADMQAFAEAAQQALQYFNPLPIVTNGTLHAPDYTYVGTNWAMRSKAGPLGIIMGGNRYPVTTNSLDYKLRYDDRLSPLLEYGLDLTLPIGACGVAMSREQLSYIPKTSTSITAALEAVIDDVVATFAHLFDTAPSEWEAMKMLLDETGVNSHSHTARGKLLMSNARYKGQKLETSFRIEPADFDRVGLRSYETRGWKVDPQRSRRSSTCPGSKWTDMVSLYGIVPGSIETLIIDDLPQSPRSKTIQRIRNYVTDQPQAKETLIIRGVDETVVPQLIELLRGPVDYVLTSSLPEPVAASKTGTKTQRPRVRMFTFNGNKDAFTHSEINNLTKAVSKEKAVAEVAYADQPASGIMVVMSSFDLPGDFHGKMRLGLVRFDELVFVNAVDAVKIESSFKRFETVFDERLAAAIAAYPELPQRLAVSYDPVMQRYANAFRSIHRDRSFDDLPAAARKRPFGRLFEAWRNYVRPLTEAQQKLASFVTISLPAGFDPAALAKGMSEDVKILLNVLKLDQADHRKILYKHL